MSYIYNISELKAMDKNLTVKDLKSSMDGLRKSVPFDASDEALRVSDKCFLSWYGDKYHSLRLQRFEKINDSGRIYYDMPFLISMYDNETYIESSADKGFNFLLTSDTPISLYFVPITNEEYELLVSLMRNVHHSLKCLREVITASFEKFKENNNGEESYFNWQDFYYLKELDISEMNNDVTVQDLLDISDKRVNNEKTALDNLIGKYLYIKYYKCYTILKLDGYSWDDIRREFSLIGKTYHYSEFDGQSVIRQKDNVSVQGNIYIFGSSKQLDDAFKNYDIALDELKETYLKIQYSKYND